MHDLDFAGRSPADNNLALQAGFAQLRHRRRIYAARRAMDALPVDLAALNHDLADMRVGIDSLLVDMSRLPATAASGLAAKANALLEALGFLDSSPEIELAQSLAADVLKG